ncbi:hypothetical protein CVO74_16515 [Xanthomonas prunicola]|uniref:Uncharacterized protein n=1 Tax=Xanthomonas prunicola TaxID=2053930 RepID=A0A2N3RGX1_9XANT|nr:hypothetical protein XpruCFBP8353_16040 [Xanthomonas prunicola]PKV16071.1 hypothetical protein XpruCFBP8354_16385 [Xanthomonas prunicola]PKV20333.1 hypothetical protein CVO74_16515 [Xanthomonas prunicola]
MCLTTCKPFALRAEGFLGFAGWHCDAVNRLVGRARGGLTARGTRRKYVHVGSVAASMPPHGPAIGEDTAPDSWLAVLLKTMHTDHLDRSLHAHPRGTLRGMDAA